MMTDRNALSIANAARAIRTKRLSPVELTEACLARIAHDDPRLDAFITVTGERARAEAHTAEDEIAAGHWRGPLHGIPYRAEGRVRDQGHCDHGAFAPAASTMCPRRICRRRAC